MTVPLCSSAILRTRLNCDQWRISDGFIHAISASSGDATCPSELLDITKNPMLSEFSMSVGSMASVGAVMADGADDATEAKRDVD